MMEPLRMDKQHYKTVLQAATVQAEMTVDRNPQSA